jgi:hypothetical protein
VTIGGSSPAISESDVTRAVILHMRSLGWREKRNHVGLFYTHNHTPIRIGVPGEPDWLFHDRRQLAVWLEITSGKTREDPE